MTRERIDELIDAGRAADAAQALSGWFEAAPSAASAAFVASRYERIAAALSLSPLRIAVLRSFTIEPLIEPLRARCFLAGIAAQIHIGGYNLFEQELLDAQSETYAFAPDVVIAAALTRDLAPALWSGSSGFADAALDAAERVRSWVAAIRSHSDASVIVPSFEQPSFAANGVLDARIEDSQRREIAGLNASLLELSRQHHGVYVLDYDALVARHGRATWSDPHKDLAMRVPLRPESFGWLADEFLRVLRPLSGRVCKAIAIDLDNTLWGGVVGEDGAGGIKLGGDYPGSAYRAVQQQLRVLSSRGILLTICSKNNPDEALAVLRDHPDMLLRPDDFAAMRINWADKAANLRELAAELNIGVDSFAFFDDNPAERQWVRAQLPDVTVIDPGPDAVHFADALRRTAVFERLSLSDEDRARANQYRAQRHRADAAAATSVDDFLRSLEMVAALADVTPSTLTRVAQLTQKTNQFNVTTRRYTEEQITRLAGVPGTAVRTVRMADRYGDNGLVGVLIANASGDRCVIDTLLLSCRVIGRGVETLMLSDAVTVARRHGATILAGEFVPTGKNAPAADLFARHGFTCVSESIWELDLTRATVTPPDCITIATASSS